MKSFPQVSYWDPVAARSDSISDWATWLGNWTSNTYYKVWRSGRLKDVASCASKSTPHTHWCHCNGGSGREPLRGPLVTREWMVRRQPRNYLGQRNREDFEGPRGRELVDETGSCRSTCSNRLLGRREQPLEGDETSSLNPRMRAFPGWTNRSTWRFWRRSNSRNGTWDITHSDGINWPHERASAQVFLGLRI